MKYEVTFIDGPGGDAAVETVDADSYSLEKGTTTAHFFRRANERRGMVGGGGGSDPSVEVATYTNVYAVTAENSADRNA